MLTKKQLDGLGLRELGRDEKGRLIFQSAELIEVDENPNSCASITEALRSSLRTMTAEELYNWIRQQAQLPKRS